MSKIEVNTVDVQCGSTLTLGSSGKTVQIACGASTSGMGRTGTVDWCTTAKTSPFTGVSGKGYFVNTTSGAITVTLPASPSAGDIIAVSDYASTWDSNSITLCRNSSKINGACTNTSISNEGAAVTLVYVDSTRGWKQVNDGTLNVTGQPNYVVASGGDTTITDGDYKIHVFTSDGNLSVTNAGQPGGSTSLDYVVIAGAGGGGTGDGGGGGAGGFRLSNSYSIPAPTISPLANPTGITAAIQSYPITVGAGGTAGPGPSGTPGAKGSDSIFSSITSTGGGFGGGNPSDDAGPGGSGGGSATNTAPYPGSQGLGNTPPVSPPQGNNGGIYSGSGGNAQAGGGAGAVGGNGSGSTGGTGGVGSFIADTFYGPTAPSYGTPGPVSSTRYFSGGGGGYGDTTGGAGGSGGGGVGTGSPGPASVAGTVNTGGGGGGGNGPIPGKAGGSGVVFIRYKFQN
jgi:hypothetical protein